jgi:tetratricopeptide (TPR) repeat protein
MREFAEGDIFYSFVDDQYHLFKLLKFDRERSTCHVLCYSPLHDLPEETTDFHPEVSIYHAPIDKNGFEKPTWLTNQTLTASDLSGFHEYLRRTQTIDVVVGTADSYYKKAHSLTDENKFELAINEYSKAIDLVPQFFEAIDNKAFCKMNLGFWKEAIKDFLQSLSVKPNNLLAEFSIGECYLKLKDYDHAKEHFEKALRIDPAHQAAKDFLKKAIELKQEN